MIVRKKWVLIFINCLIINLLFCQEKWDLQKCVNYAQTNNISIKQQDVQVRLGKLVYQQSKLANYPTVNYSTSGGYQFGRNIDPTTNLFTNDQVGFATMSLQSGVTLFNWFVTRNTKEAAKYACMADNEQGNQLKNDVSLNVIVGYLQVLQSVQQEALFKIQIAQTKEQLLFTQKKVDAGMLPLINIAELEAQLAIDSASLVSAGSSKALNLLQLKALLTLDAAMPFDITTPSIEQIPILSLAEAEPELVYAEALANQPLQLANKYRVVAAKKNTAVAKGGMYPTLSAFGNLQTSFSNATSYLPKNGGVNTSITYPIGSVAIGATVYPVLTTYAAPAVENATLFRQFGFNFREYIGLGINVSLFNNGVAKAAFHRAQLNEESVYLQNQQDILTLKQNIYQAYQKAIAAMQTFRARKKASESLEYAYELGKKRYHLNFTPILELLTLQNNALSAKINMVTAQFDYVFKMKILELYKGNGLQF